MKDKDDMNVEDLQYEAYDEPEELDSEEDSYTEDYNAYSDNESMPESSAGSWTSFILGIISSLAWIIPIIGMPVSLVGMVLGAINIRSRKAKGAAIAGFIINLVFLCVAIAKGIVDLIMAIRFKKCKICKK